MEKDPEQRYQQVSQLKTELEAILPGLPAAGGSPQPPAAPGPDGAATLAELPRRPRADSGDTVVPGRLLEQPWFWRLAKAILLGMVVWIAFLTLLIGPEESGLVKIGIPLVVTFLSFLLQSFAAARANPATKEWQDLLKIVAGVAGILVALLVFARPVLQHYFSVQTDLLLFENIQYVILILIAWVAKAIGGPWSWTGLKRASHTMNGWAILCCLLGTIVGLTPWALVQVRIGNGTKYFDLDALASWHGLAITALFLSVGLFLITIRAAGWTPWWHPLAVLGAGIVIAVFSARYLVSGDQRAEFTILALYQWQNPIFERAEVDKVGPYLALILGIGLVVLGGFSIAKRIRDRRARPAG